MVMTMRPLHLEAARDVLREGGALIDLRPTQEYLDGHVHGSFGLLYEVGPGMASRARDCIPLDLPLILLGADRVDLPHAAASLRGKGFQVVGSIPGGVTEWAGRYGMPASTDVVTGAKGPEGLWLDVGDPGAPTVEGAVAIPLERLAERIDDLPARGSIAIISGYGVRAALAVGVLERAGAEQISVWKPSRAG